MGSLKAAFFKGTKTGLPGIYNRGVRFIDKGPYSHCELVCSGGICGSSSFMDGGVRLKYIQFDTENWDFLNLPSEKENLALWWFIDHYGCEYDTLGNGRFLCGLIGNSPDRWFCSEALAASLGLKDPWRYGPNGLYLVLKELYGHLN